MKDSPGGASTVCVFESPSDTKPSIRISIAPGPHTDKVVEVVEEVVVVVDVVDVVDVGAIVVVVGGLLIGVFASPSALGGDFDGGLIEGDGIGLLGEQLLANVVTAVFAFVVTFATAKALDATIGLRVTQDEEIAGLDASAHSETAYNT